MKLDERMKTYESVSKNFLTMRTPVIIRVDGRAFHTFTKHLTKPFCSRLTDAMIETANYLCENVQNCVMAYTQSDEISLLLVDYKNIDSEQWFKGNIQKISSVSASLATAKFNQEWSGEDIATFDSRCFNIPRNDVCNYFIYRQRDCIRNNIEAVAHSLYSQKDINGLNNKELIVKIKTEFGMDCDDGSLWHTYFPSTLKNGVLIDQNSEGNWGEWEPREAPIFSEHRGVVENGIIY